MIGIEALLGIGVAIVTGAAALTQGIHNRITELDKRVDGVELRIAQQYVTKKDLNEIMTRMEGHLIRIEEKMDKMTLRCMEWVSWHTSPSINT